MPRPNKGPTEAQRRAFLDLVAHPLWFDARDHEIADRLRIPLAVAAQLHEERRRNVEMGEVAIVLRELAALIRWPGTIHELLIAELRGALARARVRGGEHGDVRMQHLREVLDEDRREQALRTMDVAPERSGAGVLGTRGTRETAVVRSGGESGNRATPAPAQTVSAPAACPRTTALRTGAGRASK